jgi:hypothetical protein
MRGTGIENEVEICATKITNTTRCMNTNAMERGKICGRKSIYEEIILKTSCKYVDNTRRSATNTLLLSGLI